MELVLSSDVVFVGVVGSWAQVEGAFVGFVGPRSWMVRGLLRDGLLLPFFYG